MDRTAVRPVVVVVGPKEVVGRGAVAPEVATAALEGLDDDFALVDDGVVSVDDLWRDVLGAAVNGPCDRLTLACPSWWGDWRLARVAAAGRHWSDDVVVVLRSELLADAGGGAAVVELGPDLVVVHTDGRRQAIARATHGTDVVDVVVAQVGDLPAVTVDVPSGLALLGANIVRALELRGVAATPSDDRTLVTRATAVPAIRWRVVLRGVGVAAVVLTAGGLAVAGVSVESGADDHTVAAEPADVAWLVEGRVAVEIPARWTVERITVGPGSARVQVISPNDHAQVIHVTQSRVRDDETLDATAAALASVLAAQPDGIFDDFTATGERADRDVVTYRELRADRRVDWTVLLDGSVRIAIGCQGTGPVVHGACDRAIRSARAVTRK